MRFLRAVGTRWVRGGAGYAVLTGDLNIAPPRGPQELEGQAGQSGFLPEEQARIDGWIGHPGSSTCTGTSTVPGRGRTRGGRGARAFDTDAGWRIDYQLASALAGRAVGVVGRAPTTSAGATTRPSR